MSWYIKNIDCNVNRISITLSHTDFSCDLVEHFYMHFDKKDEFCKSFIKDTCIRCNSEKPFSDDIVCYECYKIVISPIRTCKSCNKKFSMTIPRFFSKFKMCHITQTDCGKCTYVKKLKNDKKIYRHLWKYKTYNMHTSKPYIHIYYNDKYESTIYYECSEKWILYGYIC